MGDESWVMSSDERSVTGETLWAFTYTSSVLPPSYFLLKCYVSLTSNGSPQAESRTAQSLRFDRGRPARRRARSFSRADSCTGAHQPYPAPRRVPAVQHELSATAFGVRHHRDRAAFQLPVRMARARSLGRQRRAGARNRRSRQDEAPSAEHASRRNGRL